MTRDRAHVSRPNIEGLRPGRARRAWRGVGCLAAAAALAAPLASCTAGQTAGVSPSYLIINQLGGASGAEPDTFDSSLQSDVVTDGSIFEDPGRVILSLGLKDPGTAESPTAPTTANFITVTRYRVRYLRSDGRNTPGVDVPYPFDGAMTATVGDAGTTAILTLVRIQAKIESPLAGLVAQGGQLAISTIAEVTFYGEDQAGRDVSVTGNISVTFADWADPD
jgi:hypothetical protein